MTARKQGDEYTGLGLAIIILIFWLLSTILLIATPISTLGIPGTLSGIGLRTFLHTGLFIVAHDAMHGNLAPGNVALNQQLGCIAITLYAGLPYEHCRKNHIQHHRFPAQAGDPDFHDGINANPLIWFCHFINNYLSRKYLTRFSSILIAIAAGLHYSCGFAYLNLFYFLLLPLCFSTVQLFFFGTYRPHGCQHQRRSKQSLDSKLIYFWSLISCYHFGLYHEEHHTFPRKSWFQLPSCEHS
ncbi:fatty acid desaturase [[Leptolyngbya] sp. PCC 7376]|uniref:fatty acid desaturase n=1 Tax=[Leptolyngbya] sp. PCC 7376 TaxID=111781 RepID=UPI00029F11C0|nr:fatty acid desaturase [[Leptolyngbya] sp. PCC 7376]AFY38317.1 fatty acid desaturase [[Leptolyngbya] sp. PCC 7376]